MAGCIVRCVVCRVVVVVARRRAPRVCVCVRARARECVERHERRTALTTRARRRSGSFTTLTNAEPTT